jgi:hypothetical protein
MERNEIAAYANPAPPPIKLLKKLAAIKKELGGYVQKQGYNEAQRYSFVRDSDITQKVGQALDDHGVFLMPGRITAVAEEISRVSRDGKERKDRLTSVDYEFTFYDVDSGESLSGTMPGTGADPGDKGVYKALTGARKYIQTNTFMLATGDDPEIEPEPPPRTQTPPQKTETKPVPATSKPQVNHAPSTPTTEARPQRPASVPGVVSGSSIPEPPTKPFNGEDDTLPGRELPTPEEYKAWSTAAKEFMTANGIKTAQLKGYLKNYFEKGPAKVKEAGDLSKVPYQVLLAASKDLLTASNADTIKNFKPAETN